MSGPDIRCDDCHRRFVDPNALWQHRKFKHKGQAANPHPRVDDDDISYADLAIEAQRKEAAGERLEAWEMPYASGGR